MKQHIKNFIYQLGYDIRACNFLQLHELRRFKFLQDQNIAVILDVGANEGQYAQAIRKLGYENLIISFEPVKDIFNVLNQKAKTDSQWKTFNLAIGDFDGHTEINISEFSQVSSILSATGLARTDYWKGTHKQKVKVSQLDSLIDELVIDNHRVLLKIDTQGFEDKVLKGCQNLLNRNVVLLEVELSIRQFYSEEKLFPEMYMYIRNLGFELVSMSPVHVDAIRGYVLQYDCIFMKKGILDSEEK